jgi:hypothetical protein
MSRATRLRGSILGFVPFFLFLATFISLVATTPHDAYAIRGKLVDAGTGSGYYGLPGQGDDDQPTINPPPPRRTTVQMSEPDAQNSGSGTPAQTANLGTVRRVIVSGRDLLRRLFTAAR